MTYSEIVSHLLTFVGGVLVGALGKYFADHGTDKRRKREATSQTLTQFQRLQHMMPALIADMKNDLTVTPHARDFAVLSNAGVGKGFSWPQAHFHYYETQYDDLLGKVELLRDAGYVHRRPSNVPVFRMTQEFVDLVLGE